MISYLNKSYKISRLNHPKLDCASHFQYFSNYCVALKAEQRYFWNSLIINYANNTMVAIVNQVIKYEIIREIQEYIFRQF